MYEFDVTFRLKSRPNESYVFDGVISYGRIMIETKDGRICGKTTITIEDDDINLAREEASEELERLASMLTIIFGEGVDIEDLKVEHKPVIRNRGKVKEITVVETFQVVAEIISIEKKYSKERLDKIKAELEVLTDKIDKLRERENFLRVIKWWRRGNLEEDKIDKFLDYFISFEILASIKGYKSKYGDNWAKRFSDDYSITYKPDGKMTINWIRSKIMHEPGPERERAEKLANQYAESFGGEVLRTIKRIIEEAS